MVTPKRNFQQASVGEKIRSASFVQNQIFNMDKNFDNYIKVFLLWIRRMVCNSKAVIPSVTRNLCFKTSDPSLTFRMTIILRRAIYLIRHITQIYPLPQNTEYTIKPQRKFRKNSYAFLFT